MAAQHKTSITAELDSEKKLIYIQQEIVYENSSSDTLNSLILNDWNNSYSSKTSPLAARFSDEFVKSFHLAKSEERGSTKNITIFDEDKLNLAWERPTGQPDLIAVRLRQKLEPGKSVTLHLTYTVKIPSGKFTGYGFGKDGSYNLRQWFISAARFDRSGFAKESNLNLDDIANAVSDYDITFRMPKNLDVTSDLSVASDVGVQGLKTFHLTGKDRLDFGLYIEPKSSFYQYKNSVVTVENNLRDNRLGDIQKAIVVDRIINFVNENIGAYPHEKITVSQADYERNPFYGLNQLPAFISPFSDEFIYEIKFLKTYLNNYLKTSLKLDPRKDNWIYDGIQIYTMMKYIDQFHPDAKMMGSLSSWKLLKSFYLTNLSFNGQYSYFYMLMARKNLDQPIGDPKSSLIKFNAQIAGKYRAGLSLRYLEDYLGNDAVRNSIAEFQVRNRLAQTSEADFASILRSKTPKNIDWFFDQIINSREIVDYKFGEVTRTRDSITFTVKNKTGTVVPVPLYGVRKNDVIFKEWLEGISVDSTFTRPRGAEEKLVLNYNNEVPEYNLRNNWKSLRKFRLNNRPIKFNFLKDLENPYYNQILYVPTLTYNLYDGLSPGMRLHNKTILEKPFLFDINPAFSTVRHTLTGSALLAYTQNNRDSNLYSVRYSVSGNYFHYAPDAAYLKFNPMVTFRIREHDFRDNRNQLVTARYVLVQRDPSAFVESEATSENYGVFAARYINSKTEATHHFSVMTDLQASDKFGKGIVEVGYRNLFENNRQIDFRLYAGTFLYNKTASDFFSFALDRPTDYLFDYNYYGRSETTGLFSQQIILAEGGFKSRFADPSANQWITTLNSGVNIWNWVEAYADAGVIKSRGENARFLYDSGIRLNLVTDYFELYFPVYSSNGWEFQSDYGQRIRFIVTLDPKLLVKLFTRKWL